MEIRGNYEIREASCSETTWHVACELFAIASKYGANHDRT